MSSPCQSPKLDPQNPIPPPLPSEKAPSRPQTPARGDAPAGSPIRSPLRHADSTNPPPVVTVAKANRTSRDGASAVARLDGAGGVRAGARGLGTASEIVRRQRMTRAEAALRAAAVVLCMISFSVMASDKTEGWAGDSFDRYKEFRYESNRHALLVDLRHPRSRSFNRVVFFSLFFFNPPPFDRDRTSDAVALGSSSRST
ncbi:hypothetical protein MUK42_32012 [Musa troglodytarum]|uniref:CASP-like protein n=1 Tax=Musa troglodytarum TaxID=320322 RepID=A0A9E7JYB6_9LILI|nr:hypothetical protein MUK42_32012 [Musa troglodytarum]